MKKILLLTIVSLLFISCSTNKTICPTYPNPSKNVVDWLLQNDKVWLEKQYKLKLKLKVCND